MTLYSHAWPCGGAYYKSMRKVIIKFFAVYPERNINSADCIVFEINQFQFLNHRTFPLQDSVGTQH